MLQQTVIKGYGTGMVDANIEGDTAHNTRPFLFLELFLSEQFVEEWIEESDRRCKVTKIISLQCTNFSCVPVFK